MENLPQGSAQPAGFRPILKVIVVIATGLVLLGWGWLTPPGLLGKADAAGYAVCHRIDARSFHIGDRQTPLCVRCSGMYLGALLGIVYLARFGKLAGMPKLKIMIVLGLFVVAFAVDGLNSYLHLFPNAPRVYTPEHWLRLLTGTGVGLGIASVLMPVVHQTLWQSTDNRQALDGWKPFVVMVGLALVLDLAIFSENSLLLYPLALLSGASIFLVLSMVYTIVWVMIFKKENKFSSYRELWVLILAGFLTALLQIAVLDAGRYWLTGTWAGFNL